MRAAEGPAALFIAAVMQSASAATLMPEGLIGSAPFCLAALLCEKGFNTGKSVIDGL
jgi:hypothetical protein